MLLTAFGLLGWALAAEPWQLFAIMPLGAAGWALTGGAALNAMVSPFGCGSATPPPCRR